MNTTKVELHRRKVKLKDGRKVSYFTLRWFGSNGKRYSESVGRGATLAEAKEAARRKGANLASGAELVERPEELRPAVCGDFVAAKRTGRLRGDDADRQRS